MGRSGIEGGDGGGAVEELVGADFEGGGFGLEVGEEVEGVVEGAEEGAQAAGAGEESIRRRSIFVEFNGEELLPRTCSSGG